jgi:hypothetical protein
MRGHNTIHIRFTNRGLRKRGIAFLMLFMMSPYFVHADLVITEIMYDPLGSDSDREWIEVYNSGTSSVNLSALKTHINGKDHTIIAVSNANVGENQHALIVRNQSAFETEYGDTGAVLFTSAFSLPNAGAYISLINTAHSDVTSALYGKSDGASNDGNSLQRTSSHSDFVARTPSPGDGISNMVAIMPAKVASKTSVTVTKKSTVKKAISKKKTTTTQAAVADAWNDTTVVPPIGSTNPILDVPKASSQTAAVVAATPAKYFWEVYLAIATGLAALVGLGSEVVRRFKKDEWDVEEVE